MLTNPEDYENCYESVFKIFCNIVNIFCRMFYFGNLIMEISHNLFSETFENMKYERQLNVE